MKKTHLLLLTLVCAIVGLGGGFFLYTTQHKTPSVTKESNVTYVSIVDGKASPDFVAIHPGQYVQFNSNDGKKHILAQGHGNGFGDEHEHEAEGFETPEFGADEGYKMLFKKNGTYDFHDHENANVRVTVLVYTKDKK